MKIILFFLWKWLTQFVVLVQNYKTTMRHCCIFFRLPISLCLSLYLSLFLSLTVTLSLSLFISLSLSLSLSYSPTLTISLSILVNVCIVYLLCIYSFSPPFINLKNTLFDPYYYYSFFKLYRDWFVPIKSEAEILSQELLCERRLRSEIEQQLKVALAARVRAERERDIYKVIFTELLGISSCFSIWWSSTIVKHNSNIQILWIIYP